ncbi:putative amidase [Rhypophila decipiens]|uniref:Amidase n=1 Tax=Rhypophila decipiens TaxID=261697 RepID=A0AAN6Y1Y3_9PEZI|nr:putative amidase [Rhypophila decipiens]
MAKLCHLVIVWVQVCLVWALPSLLDATIDDLRAGLEDGDFTSVELVTAYIARITEVNPVLHAVTEINPDALEIAAELDEERAQGKCRGPLHGIPILIKNNIATFDKMNNTAGSFALLGARPQRDAFVASRLRKAGAVLLGKSNLSQWANFRSSNSSNGWSAHGGQTKGAYIPDQDPSGSSSGSGVSSSLGLAAACLGTETDGSILSPSQRNNIVGIKPTVGLTSRDLVIPISEHQDTIGPMARTVKDAAYLLSAIAGPDPNDNYTSAIPANLSIPLLPDYVAACDPNALFGARLGIPNNVLEAFASFDNTSDPENSAFFSTLSLFTDSGATIIQNADFTNLTEWISSEAEGKVLNADFITNLASYLSKLTTNPNNITSLSDLSNFTKRTAPEWEEYPSRNTATWDEALDPIEGFNNSDPRFWPFLQEDLFLGGEGGLLGALERYDLDAIILPTSMAPGFAAIIGAPVVTVPLGAYPDDTPIQKDRRGDLVAKGPGVPFGISFLGRKFDEAKLIGLAYAFEQKTQVRGKVKPYLAPWTQVKIKSNCSRL